GGPTSSHPPAAELTMGAQRVCGRTLREAHAEMQLFAAFLEECGVPGSHPGVLAALILALGASANPPGSDAASTAALQWNAYAVAAVRAATTTNQLPPGATSRSLYQTEGLLYVSY